MTSAPPKLTPHTFAILPGLIGLWMIAVLRPNWFSKTWRLFSSSTLRILTSFAADFWATMVLRLAPPVWPANQGVAFAVGLPPNQGVGVWTACAPAPAARSARTSGTLSPVASASSFRILLEASLRESPSPFFVAMTDLLSSPCGRHPDARTS
jgi:hypothetical protein